jgi:hypothetical protein
VDLLRYLLDGFRANRGIGGNFIFSYFFPFTINNQFRTVSPRLKSVGDGKRVNIPAPPVKRLSDGVTEEGRSSGYWMSWYKPVGGDGR